MDTKEATDPRLRDDVVLTLRLVADLFTGVACDDSLTDRGLRLAELAKDLEDGAIVLCFRREAPADGG